MIVNRAHVIVSGKVQGVFFRVWTRSNAKELNLTGWVKNTEDGNVEAVLEGKDEDIKQMLERMKQGSHLSKVEKVESEFIEKQEEHTEFRILT